jgi:hypothetical protein
MASWLTPSRWSQPQPDVLFTLRPKAPSCPCYRGSPQSARGMYHDVTNFLTKKESRGAIRHKYLLSIWLVLIFLSRRSEAVLNSCHEVFTLR